MMFNVTKRIITNKPIDHGGREGKSAYLAILVRISLDLSFFCINLLGKVFVGGAVIKNYRHERTAQLEGAHYPAVFHRRPAEVRT